MSLIIGVIVFFVFLSIFSAIFKFIINVISSVFYFTVYIICFIAKSIYIINFYAIFGLNIIFSKFFHYFLEKARFRKHTLYIVSLSVFILTAYWVFGGHRVYEEMSLQSLKYLPYSFLFLLLALNIKYISRMRKSCTSIMLVKLKESSYYYLSFLSFSFFIGSSYLYILEVTFLWDEFFVSMMSGIFWVSGIFTQIKALILSRNIKGIVDKFNLKTSDFKFHKDDEIVDFVYEKRLFNNRNDVDLIVSAMIAKLSLVGFVKEIESPDGNFVFNSKFYNAAYNSLNIATIKKGLVSEAKLINAVVYLFPFSNNGAKYFIDKYFEVGQYYNFKKGRLFCSFKNSHKIRTCACCGVTEISSSINNEWICSDICKKTEIKCFKIKEKYKSTDLVDSIINQEIVHATSKYWAENHKLRSPDSNTGHGFAAEKANHYFDKIKGKKARIIGDDNAKNGADRLVNGDLIQTKYCATGRRSVNSAFDSNGNYRYMNGDKPMLLEVPKDQYDQAVKTMSNKIKEGKVKGVTDPRQAKNLIIKGSVTYRQSVEITKFGTIESITFDAVEGAVVASSAAGISFGITAAIYYINTKDKSKALRAATYQAGKTFGSSLIVYVGTAQLHRCKSVVNLLKVVDVKSLSPSFKKVLGNGFGTSSGNVNKVLRGSIVTSAVVIAVSSGPEFIKMVRGRISGAQFIQNLSVVASSIVGGTVGSVAGGAIGATVGPVGMLAGRFIGGAVGGMVASSVATNIAGKLREDDKAKMIRIIKIQFEYLAVTFMVTPDEIDIVNKNLEGVISQGSMEKMYSAKGDSFAYANYLLKPEFVKVIKERDSISFDAPDIIESLEQVAA